MPAFRPGLVHCPVTPFKGDNSVDYNTYAKVLDTLGEVEAGALAERLHAMSFLQAEPRGW